MPRPAVKALITMTMVVTTGIQLVRKFSPGSPGAPLTG